MSGYTGVEIKEPPYEPKTAFFRTMFPLYLKIMKEKHVERNVIKLQRVLEPYIKSLQMLAAVKALTPECAANLAEDILEMLMQADRHAEVSHPSDLSRFQKDLRERMQLLQTTLVQSQF